MSVGNGGEGWNLQLCGSGNVVCMLGSSRSMQLLACGSHAAPPPLLHPVPAVGQGIHISSPTAYNGDRCFPLMHQHASY